MHEHHRRWTGWGLLGRRHQPVVADLGTDDHLVTCFKQDGLLEITFDEAEEPGLDTTACYGETPGPAAAAGGNGESGPGGGVVGAVLLSPFIKDGTKVTKSYNHFSSRSVTFEDLFNLPRLGEAQTVTSTFSKGGIFPK